MKPGHMEVFPGSSKLIPGLIPKGLWLLLGSPGVGKTIFCKQFLSHGLTAGEPAIFVATDESPDEIRESMKSFGFNTAMFEEKGMFRIIDCYSWRTGIRTPGRDNVFVIENPGNLSEASIAIENARRELTNPRFVMDSITGLALHTSQDTAIKCLQIVTARLKAQKAMGFFTANPGAHDERFVSLLRSLFDGVFETKVDDSGPQLKRLLRVFSFRGAKHYTAWVPFEISEKGIEIEVERGYRCALCSGLVAGTPYVERIDGKDYHFHTPECAKVFKKAKVQPSCTLP